ncbi:pilin [Shewanella sp. NFH-SH190041]|uniref:type II secretion system protein n=1 Tax=Shewanella sp. NFH-SH190041 TaxID=2950245 RepID=UPI0021C3A6CE|nr:prepilin-type N-terminal cleavage/methylation domain-containing protein [Shewanella sp. NFH-SH190041]BDM62796.1 pilin [Shewanella sp. NFH-SH190041]
MPQARGFTLIELVVVIIVLAILAVTATAKFVDLADEANEAVAKGTTGALAEVIERAHLFWQLKGIDGQIADLPDLLDGTVNFNNAGYPIEAADLSGSQTNTILDPVNANRCARVWNAFLDHNPELDSSGVGDKQYYYNINDGVFRVEEPVSGTCIYTLMDDNDIQIRYNTNNGEVTLTGV